MSVPNKKFSINVSVLIRAAGLWFSLQAMIQLVSEERRIVEYGLDLVKNSIRDLLQQLKTYRDLCLFCDHEFPKLIEKREKERKRK